MTTNLDEKSEIATLRRQLCLITIFLTGCASHHPYQAKPKSLGPPQWQCNAQGECELVRIWEPSQLTPVGCVLHKIVTFGHTAEECKKPKPGKN